MILVLGHWLWYELPGVPFPETENKLEHPDLAFGLHQTTRSMFFLAVFQTCPRETWRCLCVSERCWCPCKLAYLGCTNHGAIVVHQDEQVNKINRAPAQQQQTQRERKDLSRNIIERSLFISLLDVVYICLYRIYP